MAISQSEHDKFLCSRIKNFMTLFIRQVPIQEDTVLKLIRIEATTVELYKYEANECEYEANCN